MACGKIGSFDVSKDNWDLYIDRLGQYFIVNDIKEAVQVPTLITVMGSEAYELMVNLCVPEKPATKKFCDLVALMKSHLRPNPSLLAERFKFRQRTQKRDESIADYVTELKKLSKDCRFVGTSLKENLRDQFVCGLINDGIRQKLFTEDDIGFERALRIAVSMEAAESDAALVETRTRGRAEGNPTVAELHHNRSSTRRMTFDGRTRTDRNSDDTRTARDALFTPGGGTNGRSGAGSGSGAFRGRSQTTGTNNMTGECGVCGRRHNTNTCKFKMYVCRICNKEGHLKKMCPSLRRQTAMHNVLEEKVVFDEYNSDSGSDEVNNFSIETDNLKLFRPYTITVDVNGILLTMEIDTGSAISCISYECYQKYFKYKLDIVQSDLVLRYYTGEIVKPVGKIKPIVKYKDGSKTLALYVVDCGKTNLMGRQWLDELGIKIPVALCNNLKESEKKTFNFNSFSSRFCDVFAEGLGRFTGGTVGFHLRPEARPVFMRARPLAYALREPVERALDALVRDGVITPVATSDWATPIVPVMKKDGTIRVCGDFKLTLNKFLEVDRFPIPRVDDLLAKLHGGEKFTKLDLSQAYAQLELDESKKYTVINTHKGLFMYNRLIYGLASSPGIFQRKLEQLFADIPRVGVFLDDLIITGVDDESHLATLYEVFNRLQKYGLRIRKDKCTFFSDSVTYLGFVISKKGVHTCQDKIEAIKKAPVPSNVSELRSFLGLVMYYAKFVPNISTVLAPLYVLLKKEEKYKWTEERDNAFNKVKNILTSSEVLAHYSPDLPLVLTTDASSVGVGAVISHLTAAPAPEGERPIAYASRVLNAAEKNYSQIEKEALAIIYGVRKFHQYLYGRKFKLRTDHKPLVTIFGDKSGIPVMAASRMQRWAVLLAGYDYEIEYVRSERNAADALSRLSVGQESRMTEEKTYVHFVQDFLPITRDVVQVHTKKDNILRKVNLFCQTGWPNMCPEESIRPYYIRRNELYLDMGCIVWGYRIVIPNELRELMLKELHIGHLGMVKMKSLARSLLWWPGIDADIERACRECSTCAAEAPAPPRAPPQPWPYSTEPWSRLHIDFLGPFHGHTFLVLIDSTTKWIEAFQMQKTTASAVIKVLRETFARFGIPKEVVSDNGPPFSSKEYAEFMINNGIKLTFAAVYHPSSNGAAEGAVKLCKRAVKKSLRDRTDLDTALQAYLMAYRNVEQSTTGATPAMLLQRRSLRSRLDLLRGASTLESHVHDAQRKQIVYAGGTPREFKVGDTVWTRNYAGGRKWLDGSIQEKVGSRNYIIGREDGPPLKRHLDQIKNRWSGTFEVSAAGCSSPPTPPSASPVRPSNSGHDNKRSSDDMTRGTGAQENQEPEQPPVLPQVDPIPPMHASSRIRKPVTRYGFEID